MSAVFSLSTLKDYPDVANALGELVIVWANAEISLIGALTRVSGSSSLNQMQRAYYHLPTFDTRIKFIRSLIPNWHTDKFDKPAIDKCIEKLGKLASARNHWIHGDWCHNRELKLPLIYDHRSNPAQEKPVRAQDIINNFQAVRARSLELVELINMDDLFSRV